jgi:hypothetical protein
VYRGLPEVVAICNQCAIACLNEKMLHVKKCIQLDLNVHICQAAANVLSLDGKFSKDICKLCADICNACAEEWKHAAMGMEHCKECAEACRACAKACEEMAANTGIFCLKFRGFLQPSFCALSNQ